MAHDLIILGSDPKKWAGRYGLDPVSHPCDQCGRVRTASIPFARGTLRGLFSPPCECGNQSRTPYCMVRDPRVGGLFEVTLEE